MEKNKGKNELIRSAAFPLLFTVLIWLIEFGAHLSGVRLINLGILPRTTEGLVGIITAPFIHGDLDHILSNTAPLLIVGTGMIYFYKELAYRVMAAIWLMTGFWVWMFARPEWHIGASGLIYGFVCFLFFSGIFRRDTRLTAISLLVTFLYGSLVWGIFPINQIVSWESHLFGSVAGLFTAYYYRSDGPVKPKAQWEIDEENELLNPTSANETEVEFVNEEPVVPEIKINYTLVEKPSEPTENKGG
ncbi:MAG: rhomboid family intramembrane serine protease [Bacteroidia bacterium]|nr:rhomboid family intramembrane serine protease [Bacteroidia bacterium]